MPFSCDSREIYKYQFDSRDFIVYKDVNVVIGSDFPHIFDDLQHMIKKQHQQ